MLFYVSIDPLQKFTDNQRGCSSKKKEAPQLHDLYAADEGYELAGRMKRIYTV
jgi:hypothetical protein